jgi:hypothetical protein
MLNFMKNEAPIGCAARRCWIEGRRIWLEFPDQRRMNFPAARYPLLAKASPAELATVKLCVQGHALRWELLDEDIWVEDAIRGRFPSRPGARQKTARRHRQGAAV